MSQDAKLEHRLAAIMATDLVGCSQNMQTGQPIVSSLVRFLFSMIVVCTSGTGAVSQDAAGVKFYKLVDGRVDERTYNGFRRYHASCNHCHGSDGLGSTFGPSLVNQLPEIEVFRRIVREGQDRKS